MADVVELNPKGRNRTNRAARMLSDEGKQVIKRRPKPKLLGYAGRFIAGFCLTLIASFATLSGSLMSAFRFPFQLIAGFFLLLFIAGFAIQWLNNWIEPRIAIMCIMCGVFTLIVTALYDSLITRLNRLEQLVKHVKVRHQL